MNVLSIVLLIIGIIFASLIVFDIVFLILKKRAFLPDNKFTYYVSNRMVQINCFVILFVFCAIGFPRSSSELSVHSQVNILSLMNQASYFQKADTLSKTI